MTSSGTQVVKIRRTKPRKNTLKNNHLLFDLFCFLYYFCNIIFENEVVNLPTFAITSAQGTSSTVAKANVTPVGLSITTSTGVVLVWGEIDESQTPSYSAINESQTPSWTEVA